MKLNEIGLDKVQLEMSIATLKSLTVNSSEMTKILYALEKQIEVRIHLHQKIIQFCSSYKTLSAFHFLDVLSISIQNDGKM